MNRGIVGTSLLVGVALFCGLVLVGGATGTAAAANQTTNASLGADISSFMQASSVETDAAIEDGTFEAALNRTDDPEARRDLIEARQARIEARYQRLQAQRGSLGNRPDVRNRSIAAGVAVGAASLERSVNETERVANETGVDTERLARLRSEARSLRGPAVAELARGLAGPPGNGPPGLAPSDRGPPASARGANQSAITNRTGPPGGGGPGSSGPPEGAGDRAPTDARDAERIDPPADRSSGSGDGTEASDSNNADSPGADDSSDADAPGQRGDGGPPDEPGASERNGSRGPPDDRGR
jgi:hypothetical protein